MKIIAIDATQFRHKLDFLDAVLGALGSPDWHGKSIAAFVHSMIWGGMNQLEPPYVLRIDNIEAAQSPIREFAVTLRDCLIKARQEHVARTGRDVEVAIALPPEVSAGS